MDFGVLDCFLVYYYHPQKQYAVCVLLFFMCMGGVVLREWGAKWQDYSQRKRRLV